MPTVLTRGPWSPVHQHGEPPSAIMARAIEQAAARLPDGDWIGLDVVTALERHGIGLTRTGLYDTRGPIGEALQGPVGGQPVER